MHRNIFGCLSRNSQLWNVCYKNNSNVCAQHYLHQPTTLTKLTLISFALLHGQASSAPFLQLWRRDQTSCAIWILFCLPPVMVILWYDLWGSDKICWVYYHSGKYEVTVLHKLLDFCTDIDLNGVSHLNDFVLKESKVYIHNLSKFSTDIYLNDAYHFNDFVLE